MSEKLSTVAIVDDDAQVLQALGRLVRALGYGTRLFGRAQEFLLSSAAGEATCLLIDVNLAGGTSGLALAQRISDTLAYVPPMIFISGKPDPGVRLRAEELGCAAFLEKPVSADLLRAALFKPIASALNGTLAVPGSDYIRLARLRRRPPPDRAGTLPPARRASDSPMAMACLRLVTFLPERPLRRVPRLRSCIARFTFF